MESMSESEFAEFKENTLSNINARMTQAYYQSTLNEYLNEHNLSLPNNSQYQIQNHSKIIVVGGDGYGLKQESQKIVKRLGIPDKDVDYYLDYTKNEGTDIIGMVRSSKYSDALIGPISHKTEKLGEAKSANSFFEKHNGIDGLPKIHFCTNSNGYFKLSVTNFEEQLKQTTYYRAMLDSKR